MTAVLIFAGGLLLGLVLAFILRIVHSKQAKELADEIYRRSEAEKQANINTVIDNVKSAFGNLSLEALGKSTDQLLTLAKTTLGGERAAGMQDLESKKQLIDQHLQTMKETLQNVSERLTTFDGSLKKQAEETQRLTQTTSSLREALSSTKARGQWGERMAEDVLRLAGFVEQVNYTKQTKVDSTGKIPDFTFLLPQDLKLNMDVKFPLDNYLRYLEANGSADQSRYREAFLRNVKDKIKDTSSREYINPEQNTVDYVLLFIPNEQVYAFIHEQDRTILDEALKAKVIFCSPLTLFAILAVVRQAVDNFALERTSHQILALYAEFQKQWSKFVEKMEKLGRELKSAQDEYEEMTSTRRRQLDKVLDKIEDLREQKHLQQSEEAIAVEEKSQT